MDSVDIVKKYIADNYNLDSTYTIELVADYINLVFLIKNEFQQFIFRIFPIKKEIRIIKSEIELLNFLENYKLNIESAISNSKGIYYGTIQIHNSIRNCAMYNALSGSIYDELLTEKQSKNLGEVTGQLHSALDLYCGQSNFKRFSFDELVWTPWKIIKLYIHHNVELYEFYRDIIESCENKLRKNKGLLSWGLCHGDLHAGNVIFNQNDEAGLFDFELCCKSWRLYDIATFIWSIVPREDYSIETVELIDKCIKSFLEGYMKQRTLSNEELELIFDIVLLRHIWRQAERIDVDTENSWWKSEHHFEEQMNRMKKWIQIYGINFEDN